MVNITCLERNKLSNLFYESPSFHFEIIFLSEVIYSGIRHDGGSIHCSKRDLPLIINRLQTFNISVVGIETSTNYYQMLNSFPF